MAVDEHMTLAEFDATFPEFCDVSPEQKKMALEHCKPRTSAAMLGSVLNQAHGLLAAHTLAVSPFGQQARLVSKEGMTTYKQQFAEVVSETVLGVALSGGENNIASE